MSTTTERLAKIYQGIFLLREGANGDTEDPYRVIRHPVTGDFTVVERRTGQVVASLIDLMEAERSAFARGEEAMRARCAHEIARWGAAALLELPLSTERDGSPG